MIDLEYVPVYEPLHYYRVTFKWFDGSHFRISQVDEIPANSSELAVVKAMSWMKTHYDGEMPVNYTAKVKMLKEV